MEEKREGELQSVSEKEKGNEVKEVMKIEVEGRGSNEGRGR